MIAYSFFPRLKAANHRVTSPPTTLYNCIAWAVGDTNNWWQAGLHWPFPTHPLDDTVAELKRVFESLGYQECPIGDLEPGFDKVALFAVSEYYTHAARQLDDGKWTSKLGNEDDIEHDSPESVAGGIYGEVVHFMKRTKPDAI
jgi:hypothetical protein